MTSLSNEEVFAELYYTRKIIKEVVGVTPRCWRPAQGDVDNRVRVIAAGLNMTNILWTDDTVRYLYLFQALPLSCCGRDRRDVGKMRAAGERGRTMLNIQGRLACAGSRIDRHAR